ncbi:MAG: MATE family efflux transporter [Lachnospiraceae bacterium]|nr:MATE family efflux transporter [Lachnospiraceae bacterium]
MARTKETNMTEGSIVKHILIFAIPLFIGNVIQQLYNMVDTVVVGKFVSEDALAATGACGSVNFLFFSLTSGLAIGIGIIASHDFGASDEKQLRKTIVNSTYVLGVTAAVVTVAGVLLARPILVMLKTPEAVLEDAVTYLTVTTLGTVFIVIYNGVSAILRAIGNSKMPLIFLIISSLLNIVLDLLFVLGFGLGVLGVAVATVIAQAISAGISLIYAFARIPYFRVSKEDLKPVKGIILKCFGLGVPVAIQSAMIAISLMVLQGVVNSFNDTAIMGAFTISGKVDILESIVYNTIGAAFTTFAGQNLGAGKRDRIKQGYRIGMMISLGYTLVSVPFIILFSDKIAGLFVNSEEVIQISKTAIRIAASFYFALGTIHIPRGILNGIGDAGFALINGLTEVVCRILFANLLVNIPAVGLWGIWWAGALTWIFTSAVCNIRCHLKIGKDPSVRQEIA